MPLIEHLKELQKRFIRALIAAAVGAIICFLVHDYHLYDQNDGEC